MSDKSHLTSQYEQLLVSIDSFVRMSNAIKDSAIVMDSLTDYLSQNKGTIVRFRKVTDDLQKFLYDYDFSKEALSDSAVSIRQGIEVLHPLIESLVTLTDEAKRLINYPDRYNSKQSIETCKKLVLACREKMCLEEAPMLSQLVEENTGKLVSIRKLLERDNAVLQQIHASIDADKHLLQKFKAFYAELRQFVSDFPHSNQNDLTEVQHRILEIKKINTAHSICEKNVLRIKNCCNRYNQGRVLADFNSTTNSMISSMRFGDFGQFEQRLNTIGSQAQAVCDAFNQEHDELVGIRDYLSGGNPDIWREDNERIMSQITGLLFSNTRRVDFDINQIKSDISKCKANRLSLIEETLSKSPWLVTRKRYSSTYNDLVMRCVYSNEYHSAVSKLRRTFILRTFLWFFPIIGWIILFLDSQS